jgi:hypothetical protein
VPRIDKRPNHVAKRREEIIELIFKLAGIDDFVKATNAQIGIYHDIATNLYHLTWQAEYWQDYCRKTGWDPFARYTTEELEKEEADKKMTEEKVLRAFMGLDQRDETGA